MICEHFPQKYSIGNLVPRACSVRLRMRPGRPLSRGAPAAAPGFTGEGHLGTQERRRVTRGGNTRPSGLRRAREGGATHPSQSEPRTRAQRFPRAKSGSVVPTSPEGAAERASGAGAATRVSAGSAGRGAVAGWGAVAGQGAVAGRGAAEVAAGRLRAAGT